MNNFIFLFSIFLVSSLISLLVRKVVSALWTKRTQQKYLSILVPEQKSKDQNSKTSESGVMQAVNQKLAYPPLLRAMSWLNQKYDLPKDVSLPNLLFIQLGLLFICWNISGFAKISFFPLVLLAGVVEVAGAFFFLQKRRLIDQFDKAFPQLLDSLASIYQIHPDLKQSLEYSKALISDPISKRFLTEVDQISKIGVPTVQSLEIMASKWQYPPLSFLISSIRLHQISGGDLAHLFRQTAKSFRRQHNNRKAMQSVMFQNKVSSIVVSSLVPVVLLLSFALSKNYRAVILTEPFARTLIVAASIWWFIGVIVMWRALRVKV